MRSLLAKQYHFPLLLIFSIPLFFIGVTNVHAWGDDYAQYIKEAQNIALGKPYYLTNYIYNDYNVEYAPPEYPPGFPLLLSPVVKLFGISIKPMLCFISLMIAALLLALFYYFKKFMPHVSAMCMAIIGAYSGPIIDLKWHVLSDIPLVLFVALYFLVRSEKYFSAGRLFFLVFISIMAVLIRTQAIILLLAEGLYLFVEIVRLVREKKFGTKYFVQSESLKVILGFTFGYFILINSVFNTPNNSLKFYAHLFAPYTNSAWEIITSNVYYLFELLVDMLHYSSDNKHIQFIITIIQYSALLFAIIGLILSIKRGITIEIIFFILMCLLIVVTPLHQGLRYLLPILPVYLLLVYRGIQFTASYFIHLKRAWVPIFFTGSFLALGFDNFKRIPYQPDWNAYNKEDTAAFEYIRKNISDNDMIVFAKPRALTLYTDKKCINTSWQVNSLKNKEKFDALRVKNFLIKQGVDEGMVLNYLKDVSVPIDTIIINDFYTLFRLK